MFLLLDTVFFLCCFCGYFVISYHYHLVFNAVCGWFVVLCKVAEKISQIQQQKR